MSGTEWTAAERSLVRTLIEQGNNDAQIFTKLQADGINRTYKAVQRLRQRHGWHAQVQPSPFVLDKAVALDAERALLLFDIHAPLHDAAWINRVINLALKWNVDTVGIGGDLVDFSSISYWGRCIGIELRDELDAGQAVMKTLAACFRRKVLAGGNHEHRMVKALKGALRMQDVLDEFVASPCVTTTNKTWFELRSGGHSFRVCHPGNYSRNPTWVASRLASKYRCSVIGGHDHLWGQTRDVSNGWWAIDAGCCLDPQRVTYLEDQMTTFPQPVQGAVIVIDGTPILLGEQNIAMYEKMMP
jgi:hypothetical protein